MDIDQWDISFAWDGSLRGAKAPDMTLYDAVFRVHAPLQAVVDALRRLAGEPQRRFGLLGRRLEFHANPYALTLRGRGDAVEIRAGNRLRAKPLQRIFDRLAEAGGEDLHLDARVREFCSPGANIRACKPCQAGAIRRA